MKILPAVLLLTSIALSSRAGEPLSSQHVVATVLRENPSVKAARARWDAMKERVPQARAWDDPIVGADIKRFGTSRFDDYSDVEYRVSQTLPIAGKNLSRGRAASAEALAAYEDLRRVALDVTARARVAYSRLANAYGQLDINDRNVDLLKQFTVISRAKYEAGVANQSDVLLAETNLARLRETRANIERDRVAQESLLNALMNRAASAPIAAPQKLSFRRVGLVPQRLEREALVSRPEIARAEQTIAAAKARLELAHREWIPDPEIRIQGRQVKNGGGSGISEYDTGIAFKVPWVNPSKYSAGVREAKLDVEEAERNLDAARSDVLALVRDQLKKIQTAAENYTLFRDKLLPLAQKTIESTQAGYESDKISFLDLLVAQRTIQDVESAALDHLTNYHVGLAELDAIVGSDPRPVAAKPGASDQ